LKEHLAFGAKFRLAGIARLRKSTSNRILVMKKSAEIGASSFFDVLRYRVQALPARGGVRAALGRTERAGKIEVCPVQ
jgi:hypothetical protein